MPLERVDPFYNDVPVFTQFSGVIDLDNYRPLPDDWWLATGDIVDSTGAIAAGSYKSVNMAGAALISAVLNALGHQDLPFVFGGDGALVALPAAGIEKAKAALAALRTWAKEAMGLEMRAALVPIRDVRASGLDVRVARFRVSEFASYAMFAGGGASWAEAQMKNNRYSVDPAPAGAAPDLEGLSCRWSPIPARHGAIVSIIAMPGPANDMPAFARLVEKIVAITGSEERDGHPVPAEGPEPRVSGDGIRIEGRAGPPAGRIKRFLKAVAATVFAFALIRWKITVGRFDPVVYRRDVADNSDFRKFDDGLKMTVDIDSRRLAEIEALLRDAAARGVCRYGLSKQDAALMTCIVLTALERDHMHFIDGAAGGYARAAEHLKASALML
ncbi:DUF3095 domain-containing protein [Rhizobium sp. TRM95796]|uniref:DUF3095 domain-containing protein n=1 Tax=Rhizobium sp. TRM95796 TaxID=2979862 RepID=UPI0021E7499F|nr:DUF3095 domain-containing protein [Rhizobium sp. TRM95796]MCV3767625.1 DUF3095 domain-containing protein [Rhizobium sp. TRM95796]